MFLRRFQWLVDVIFPPRAAEMLVRNTSIDELRTLYRLRETRIAETSIMSLLPYQLPLIQAVITEAKFENNQKAQELLGQLLADYIKVSMSLEMSKIVIVPLPLGRNRRRERGYNQVEEVAKQALRALPAGVAFIEMALLMRTRETLPQTSLGRDDRLKNMAGAFGACHPADPSVTYLLLDDVVTTGATLLAARQALIHAGARHVLILALAH